MRPLALVALLLLGSCDLLRALPLGSAPKPKVTLDGVAVVRRPSAQALSAVYCPGVASARLGPLAGQACATFFGAAPATASLAVAFDAAFRVDNTSNVSVPLVDILAAVTLFPGDSGEGLGAVCVHLAADGAGGGAPAAGSCRAAGARTLDDFAAAAPGFLVAAGLSLAAGEAPSFRAPLVPPGGSVTLHVGLSLEPARFLTIARRLAEAAAQDLAAGRRPTFTVPYRIAGSLAFDVGGAAVAVDFGPIDGVWRFE